MDKNRIGMLVGALFIGSAIWYYLKRWDRKNAWVAGLGMTREERRAQRDAAKTAREMDRRTRRGGFALELPVLQGHIAVGPLSGHVRWIAMGINRGWVKDNGDGTYQIHSAGRWRTATEDYAAFFVIASLQTQWKAKGSPGGEGGWAQQIQEPEGPIDE